MQFTTKLRPNLLKTFEPYYPNTVHNFSPNNTVEIMGAANPKISPKEQMREYSRGLKRATREIDRERTKLQNEEKKMIAEIKRLAKTNNIGPVKVMAKDLVRLRRHIQKFYEMKSQISGIDMRLKTMSSTQTMAEVIRGVTPALVKINKQMNMPELNNMMKEFYKENQRMEMTEEMMGDAVDMALDHEDDDTETDQIVGQVLSEIGVEISGQLEHGSLPSLKKNQVEEESKSSDLESRFAALR
jgi:charged multivesicular body protein 2A